MSQTQKGPYPTPVPSSDDDMVARLLRGAGHRPEAPKEDAALIKEAVRAEWKRTVAARRRRFFVTATGGLLAAAALLLLVFNTDFWRFSTPPVAEPELAATVEAAADGLTAASQPLHAGDVVVAGTLLETEDARAVLRLASGPTVRLDANTRLRVTTSAELDLERGAIDVDSNPTTALDPRIAVHTPMGSARNVGTRFEVRLLDGSLRLRVRAGTVVLNRTSREHVARAGVELVVRADGTVAEGLVPPCGSAGDWVLDVLPNFDAADGRSLRELLQWAAREGGCERVSFADEELAERILEAKLYGPLPGLSLGEKLEVVAPSLGLGGLSYRLQEGVLLVEERPGRPGEAVPR